MNSTSATGKSARNKRVEKYTVIAIAAAFGIYNLLRAWFVDFTHDEAFTFNQYVRAQIWDIVRIGGSNSNNHVLSTLAIKLFYLLFGSHWLVLRLAALISYGFFMYFSYKLLRLAGSTFIVLSGFIVLSSNPFLFDFFSMARGYAPATACLAASLFFTALYMQQPRIKLLVYVLVTSAAAVFFHLSFLNYFIPLLGLLGLYMLLPKNASGFNLSRKQKIGHLAAIILTVFLTVAYALPQSLYIKSLGEMDLAGNNGFWHDTVASLINFSFYGKQYAAQQTQYIIWAVVFFTALAAVVMFFAMYKYRNERRQIHYFQLFVLMLVITMVVSIVLQHYILGNRFPDGRLALYFVSVFCLVIMYALRQMLWWHKPTYLYTSAITVLLLFHFLNSANLKYTFNWIFDADTEEMLADVQRFNISKDTVNLGADWLVEPSINYYRINGNAVKINNITREGFLPLQEYFYCLPADTSKFNPLFVSKLKLYKTSGNVLLKNDLAKSQVPFYSVYSNITTPYMLSPGNGSPAIIIDSVQAKNLLKDSVIAVATAWVSTENDYVGGNLVISTENTRGEAEIWKSGKVSDAIIKTNTWQRVQYACVLPPVTAKAPILKCYLWNSTTQQLQIKWLKLQLYSYKQGSIIYSKP